MNYNPLAAFDNAKAGLPKDDTVSEQLARKVQEEENALMDRQQEVRRQQERAVCGCCVLSLFIVPVVGC